MRIKSRNLILNALYGSFVNYASPSNLTYYWNFGVFLLFFLVIQIVLLMYYTPHIDLAFDSVEHIMRDLNYGWLLRHIHSNGASFFTGDDGTEVVKEMSFMSMLRSFRFSLNQAGISIKSNLPVISQVAAKVGDIDNSVPENSSFQQVQTSVPVQLSVSINSIGLHTVFDIKPTIDSPFDYDKISLDSDRLVGFSGKEVGQWLLAARGHHTIIHEFVDLDTKEDFIAIIGFCTTKDKILGIGANPQIIKTTPISVSSVADGVRRGQLYFLDGNGKPQYFSLIVNNEGIIIMSKKDYSTFKLTYDNSSKKGWTSGQVQVVLDHPVVDSNKSPVGTVGRRILKEVVPSAKYVIVPNSNPAGIQANKHVSQIALNNTLNLNKNNTFVNKVSVPLSGEEGVD